jgi:hypothetical protein
MSVRPGHASLTLAHSRRERGSLRVEMKPGVHPHAPTTPFPYGSGLGVRVLWSVPHD